MTSLIKLFQRRKLTPDIRFVDDFSLDELLDDVFQRNESDRFVKRISFSFAINALNEGHVALLSVLEFPEHDIERRVLEDKVARVLVKLANGFEGRGIFRIHES